MRTALFCLILTAACSPGGTALQNPFNGVQTALSAPDRQRGAVELAVKGQFPQVLADINAGGGAALTEAFDAARVPPEDRATRVIQLQSDVGLYAANPGALVTALLVYGG